MEKQYYCSGGINLVFFIVFILVILQRVVELVIARRNEKVMYTKGAYEVGASHYPFIVVLHIGFLMSLLIEVSYDGVYTLLSPWLLVLYLLLQVVRVWCIQSLGVFWNTKILVLRGAELVVKGPYKYLRHPNYAVVCLEILLLPAMFGAYFTAFVFTILNLWMLSIRIPLEEEALNYASVMNRNANN